MEYRRYAKFYAYTSDSDAAFEALKDFHIGVKRGKKAERAEGLLHLSAILGTGAVAALSFIGMGALAHTHAITTPIEDSLTVAESFSLAIGGLSAYFSNDSEEDKEQYWWQFREGIYGITQAALSLGLVSTAVLDVAESFSLSPVALGPVAGTLGFITTACCLGMAALDQWRMSQCEDRIHAMEKTLKGLNITTSDNKQELRKAKERKSKLEIVFSNRERDSGAGLQEHYLRISLASIERDLQTASEQLKKDKAKLVSIPDITGANKIALEQEQKLAISITEDKIKNLQRKKDEIERRIHTLSSQQGHDAFDETDLADVSAEFREEATELQLLNEKIESLYTEQRDIDKKRNAIREAILIERATHHDLKVSRNSWVSYATVTATITTMAALGVATAGIGLVVTAVLAFAGALIFGRSAHKKHHSKVDKLTEMKKQNTLIASFHDICNELPRTSANLLHIIRMNNLGDSNYIDLCKAYKVNTKGGFFPKKISLENYISKLIIKDTHKAEKIIKALEALNDPQASIKALFDLVEAMSEKRGIMPGETTGAKLLKEMGIDTEKVRQAYQTSDSEVEMTSRPANDESRELRARKM